MGSGKKEAIQGDSFMSTALMRVVWTLLALLFFALARVADTIWNAGILVFMGVFFALAAVVGHGPFRNKKFPPNDSGRRIMSILYCLACLALVLTLFSLLGKRDSHEPVVIVVIGYATGFMLLGCVIVIGYNAIRGTDL